jgi:putative ABC transport system permease protein
MLRSKGFFVTAALLLGLGLGVNVILFNTVYALLWRPLAFPDSERLVTLSGRSVSGHLEDEVTGADAYTLLKQTDTVAAIGLTAGSRRLVTFWRGNESLDFDAVRVDSGYFRALAIRPAAGRFFDDDDDLGRAAEPSIILTESAWRTRFAADWSIVGRVMPVQEGASQHPARIVGIAPSAATLPFAADAEILMALASRSEGVRNNRGDALYRSIVRLRPGLSLATASGRINAALQATERGSSFGIWGNRWVELLSKALAPVDHRVLLLVYGSACLLLLLTCANLASLFIARSLERTLEIGVRLALGGTRRNLLSDAFQETALVGLAGGILAFLVEIWMRPAVPRLVPQLHRIGAERMATSPTLLAFGLVVCMLVSLIVGLASCHRIEAGGLATALSKGGRGVTGPSRLRSVLAAAQLAIVLTLLTVAGLVCRSFLSAVHTDPGFNPRGMLTFTASLPGAQRGFLPALLDLSRQVAASAGVRSVTFAIDPPVGGNSITAMTAPRSGDLHSTDPMIAYRFVGPAYFETLGASVASGRTFSNDEIEQGRSVAILDRGAAQRLFGNENPVGRTIQSAFGRTSVVVGVMKDIRTEGLDRAPAPMVYLPYMSWGKTPHFLVRTTAEPLSLAGILKARAHDWNSGVVLQRFEPVHEMVDRSVRERVVAGALVGGFALLGLVISSVGLCGTVAAQVQQRRREIGVRIALGASVRSIVGGILGSGLRILAFGAAGGLAASAAAARLVEPHLYGVRAFDLDSFGAALALLSIGALAACLIPAVRAARIDPIRTLNAQ